VPSHHTKGHRKWLSISEFLLDANGLPDRMAGGGASSAFQTVNIKKTRVHTWPTEEGGISITARADD